MRPVPLVTITTLLAAAPTPAVGAPLPPPYWTRQISPSGEPASRVTGWAIDPRGEWLAYVGDVKSNFRISPDSTRVAYIADQISDERFFPFSVPIAGPSDDAVVLYQGLLTVAADAQELAFTPDGTGVVFRFDLAVDQRFDLYLAPADGSAAQTRITNRGTNPAPARSVAFRWSIHPDGERVFYQFDEFAPFDERGLGEQRIVDPYEADLRLNGVPVAGGDVDYFALFPDAAGLAYRSDEDQDGKFELFTVDLRLLGDGFEEGATGAWGDLP